jgi:hypothetical protein
MSKFIAALNSLNTPWVAIAVIVLGMVFDIVCQKYGVSNDAATGVIGAGIGLLTGQALHQGQQQPQQQAAPNPQQPEGPAQPPK